MQYTFDDNTFGVEVNFTAENVEAPLKETFISSIEKGIALTKEKNLPDTKDLIPDEASQDTYFELSNLLSGKWNYAPVNYFSKVQKWVGNVIEINDKSFMGKLKDLTQEGTDEIAEFDLKEVSPEDIELVKLGAGFYWSIGYANKNGQVKKESILRFQRLSAWTVYEFDKVSDRARYLSENLKWEL
jgi:hypothetical protein